MRPFKYVAPDTLDQALALFWGSEGSAAGLAGGTELLALVKTRLAAPGMVIDLKRIRGLSGLRHGKSSLAVGALTTLAAIARDPVLREGGFGALAEAAEAVGTPQIRNRATLGGNLCQRPRCVYLRSLFRCFKAGGSSCPARDGFGEQLAILGTSGSSKPGPGGAGAAPSTVSPCLAVHPSDPAVALAIFDARLSIASAAGRRTVRLDRFFVHSKAEPSRDTVLGPGDILCNVRLSAPPAGTRSAYVKAKDRSAFAFALASAAAAVRLERGVIRHVSLALGGVAAAPWRARRTEELLLGKRPSQGLIEEAVSAELEAACPLGQNGYKIELAASVACQALARAAGV